MKLGLISSTTKSLGLGQVLSQDITSILEITNPSIFKSMCIEQEPWQLYCLVSIYWVNSESHNPYSLYLIEKKNKLKVLFF